MCVRETHECGRIRTAAEPTAACGGSREARLGQRSAFSKPCQGAAEKAASATRKARRTVRRAKKPLCNSDDRCQRQKQGGAVGAAASRMRVPPKARCSRWEPRPGLLILRGSRNPPAPTHLTAPVYKNTEAVLFVSAQGCSSMQHTLEVEKNGAFVTNLSQKGYKRPFSSRKDCETIVYLVSYRGDWRVVPVCEKK